MTAILEYLEHLKVGSLYFNSQNSNETLGKSQCFLLIRNFLFRKIKLNSQQEQ